MASKDKGETPAPRGRTWVPDPNDPGKMIETTHWVELPGAVTPQQFSADRLTDALRGRRPRQRQG